MLSPKEFVDVHLKRLSDYITSVTGGTIVTGRYQRLAVERFIALKSKYEYREADLIRVLKFCSLLNIHLDNRIGQVQLLGWQLFVIASVYCFYKDERTRLVTSCYVELAKKNGKTSLISIAALFEAIGDSELNANVVLLANSREQARTALDIVKGIITNSPLIQPFFTINKNVIINVQPGSINKIEIKASISKLVQGGNFSMSLVDEYSVTESSELADRIRSGSIGRLNPLQCIITSASNNLDSAAYKLREVCINILEGDIQNDSTFTVIYGLDDKSEIEKPECWIKANPSLGLTVQLERLISDYEQCKLIQSSLNTFITDNLCYWLSAVSEVWVEDEIVKQQMRDNRQIPEGAEVVLGLDLSASRDLTAIAVTYYDKNTDEFISKVINVFPDNQTKMIKNGEVDLSRWIDEGYVIHSKKSPVLDEDLIYDLIMNLNKRYKINSIGLDLWNSQALKARLENKLGCEINGVKQHVQHLSYPLKIVEKYLLTGKYFLEANPCVKWQFRNVQTFQDTNGNIKIMKHRGRSVDAIVALNIAMHEHLAYAGQGFDNLDLMLKK